MPALSNLPVRLARDEGWDRDYRALVPEAERIASTVHLVHVTGPGRCDRTPDELDPLAFFVAQDTCAIPVSTTGDYCSTIARGAEARFNLGPSVYFFAGRAHPNFGYIALAFPSDIERGMPGSATPFDSGAFFWRPPKIRGAYPWKADADIDAFVTQSTCELAIWRGEFAKYLAAYFQPLRLYWTGCPTRADPEGVLTYSEGAQDWRAWVWEVRINQPIPIQKAAAWSPSRAAYHAILEEIASGRTGPLGAGWSVVEWLTQRCQLAGEPSIHYASTMDEWVMGQSRVP